MRRGLTRSGAGLAVGLATLLSVTACGPGDLPRDSTGPAALPAAPVAQPVAAPSVALNGKPPSPTTVDSVALGKPVAFSIADGTLAKVSVQDDDGVALAGTVGSGGRSWVNTDPVLPSSTYTATLYVADRTGTFSQHVVHFSTPAPAVLLDGFILPDGTTVGVGSPIVVSFNLAVPDKAAVQRRLSVTMSQPVEGAWHWISAREVHFRPKDYWPTGEHLDVALNLKGYDAGAGMWGVKNHTSAVTIGDAIVSRVDVAAHTMTVTRNGEVLRRLPISAGSAKYPSSGGVHIVLEKQSTITMDSATVGIPRESPDGYYETVLWDVRISNGGAFVHAAPWSVGVQGSANVSHGCVNLSTDSARWFYNLSQSGDVVEVVNSSRPPDLDDAGTADWNLSWASWLEGDALAGAAGAAGPNATPLPTDTPAPAAAGG